jgi:HK97 family phage portal protein
VRIISESVAMLPLNVYRRMATGGKELASNHPLFSVLSSQPNDWQTSFEWREMMTAHVLLRGNAYSEVYSNNDGSISQLIPRNPNQGKQGRIFFSPR